MKRCLSFALAVAASSTLIAEDARVPFERGVRINVMISRPSKIKGGDFDDFMQVIEPRVKFVNNDSNQAYHGYQAYLMIIAESVVDRKVLKVVSKDAIPVNLEPRTEMEQECTKIELRYDVDGAVFGEKYDGWIVVVGDSKGEVVEVKSSSSSLEKLTDKMKDLKPGGFYTKKLEPTEDPQMIGR